MFVVGLLCGRIRAVLAAAVLMAAAGWVLGPAVWPDGGTVASAGRPAKDRPEPIPTLTAYFHNTWAGNRHTDAVVAAADDSGADVLLFAETSRWRSAAFAPLATHYPYDISCVGREECDLTLFSRLPIEDPTVFHDRTTGARAIAANIGDSVHGRVRVVAVHLARPIPPDSLDLQMRQVDAILRAALFRTDLPILLIGDFNAVPWGRVVRTLTTRLHLRRAGGIEGTWPDFIPLPLRVRIDQAMVTQDLEVRAQNILPGHGSDHLALAVTVGPWQ